MRRRAFMNLLIFITVTYTMFALQASLARDVAIFGFTPHLILAGLAVMTVRSACAQAMLQAAAWGLLADCVTEGRLGPQMVSFTIFAVMLQRTANRRSINVPWKLAASSIPLCWGALLADQLWRALADARPIDYVALTVQAAGSAIYTGLIALGAAYILRFCAPASTESTIPSAPCVSNKWRMLTG
jgi:rod shape-determining protein MreD